MAVSDDLLRRIGEMLVLNPGADIEIDTTRTLVDVAEFDGKTLLEKHRKRHAKFGTVPFDPCGETLRLYPGGVTIWSGYPGTGKTTLLRQFVCHCLHRGSQVFLASLEEDPEDVLVRLAATAAGDDLPNAHQMQWFIDAYAQKFRLWGQIGMAKHVELLKVIKGLAHFGIKHAVIDSLMCLDVANDDLEAQRNFANQVAATARSARIHIHLVAHPRKLISADQELDINDVAGARELGGIADNVVFIRRAKDETTSPDGITPMMICVRKQRHGAGRTGTTVGWYHRRFRQFHADQFPSGPTRYLPEDAYA